MLPDIKLKYFVAKNYDEGHEAICRLLPDICFVDINLPNQRSGIDLIHLAKERTHARVVVLSNQPVREMGNDAWRAGATAYLEKKQIPELRKQRDLFEESLGNLLRGIIVEQAEVIKNRFRTRLLGARYKIGAADFVVGTDVIEVKGADNIKISEKEKEILSYFCNYPREILTKEDFDRQMNFLTSGASERRLEAAISKLRANIKIHVDGKTLSLFDIDTIQGKGYRLGSDIQLVDKANLDEQSILSVFSANGLHHA